jgi:hypothetical protein
MTRCEQTCGVKLVSSSEDSPTSFEPCSNMKVPYVKRPCIIIYVARWGLAWPGLLLFGYLILSRKLSNVFPKNPMTIEQLGQVLKT